MVLALLLSTLAKVTAATTGFNQTAAGPFDYNTAGNWAGSTINGLWNTDLTLAAGQTVTFAADTTLTTGLTFNYAGNFALTLQASAAGTKNLTLGGDIGLNTGGGTTANVTIGNSANHLNFDLGGATRTTTVAASRTLTFVDVVSNGGLIKAGSGTLTLSGANTYSGGLTVNAGTVNLNNTTAAGSGTITLAGGIIQGTSGTDLTIANNIFAQASTTSTLQINGANNITFSGNLSGSGALNSSYTGSGAKAVVLSGNNSGYSGTCTVNNNSNVRFRFGSANAGSASAIWVFNNNTTDGESFNFGTGNIYFGSFSGGGQFRQDTAGTTTMVVGDLNPNDTFSGTLNQSSGTTILALTKSGTGRQTLSGASSYTGTTTVQNGSLIAGASVNPAGTAANGPFGNSTAAIALGDVTTISSATAMNPQLLIGGAFTMGRPVTAGANNNSLGNASTTFTLGGSTANSSTFSGPITLNQNLIISQVASGTLNVTAGITSGSSGTQTVTVNNAGPVNIGTTAIGGGTGTIALTKNGTSTLTLTGTHTYSGATTVSNGTLLVNGSTASGSAISVSGSGSVLGGSGAVNGNATINSSGALTPRPSGGSATTLTFGGNLTLASASANFTLSSSASGANDKVVYGSSSTLTLDNTDTINITGTPLDTAADYTLFSSTGGSVSMATTPVLKVNGVTSDQTSVGSYQLQISGSSLVLHYIQAAAPPVVNSTSASPSSLGHFQTTTITVNATPAAGKSITSVTVGVDGLGGIGNPVTLTGPGGDGTGNWTGSFVADGSLAAGSYTVSGFVNQSDGGAVAWSVSGIAVTNASPVWSGGGSDNKWSTIANWNSGVGPAPGAGDNVAFAGTTQTTNNVDRSVSIGSLTFNSGAGSFNLTNSGNVLTLAGGLTNNSSSAQTLDVPVALSAAQNINAAAGDIALNRAVSDSGAGLTKIGNGTLVLSGVNTYTGPTTISAGQLTIAGAGQLGGGTYSASIADNGALNYNSSAAQTLSGLISGTGAITNGGAGTLTLGSGSSTFSGGVAVNSGTVNFTASSTPTSGTVTSGPLGSGTVTLNGGTLVNGATELSTANSINVTAASNLKTGSGASGFNWNLNGNLVGSGNVTYSAANFAATLRLGGDNHAYSGTFTVSGQNAAFQWTSSSAGSPNATWALNNNFSSSSRMSFSFGSGTIELGALSGNGLNLQNNSSSSTVTMNVGALNTDSVFSGTIIANSGTPSAVIALTKVGTGSLTLSGANTYTGNTTVSAGTLLVNGSLASGSAVAVQNTATLGGSGTISGAVTVNAGGTLAPGTASIGTLTLGSTLSLAGTASFRLNKTGATLTSDQVAGATSVTAGGTLTVTASGDSLTDGNTFTLFNVTPTGIFAVTNLPSVSSANWYTTNNFRTLTYNAWPTAGTVSYTHNKGISLKIAIADLLTHVTGAVSGKTITLTSLGNPGISGASLASNSDYILYTPGLSDANDSFTYTVSDGRGGSATGTVNVVADTTAVFGQTSPQLTLDGNGNIAVTFHGIPGYTYVVQRSTDLNSWSDLSTHALGVNDSPTFTITDTPGQSAYYRLKWQP